MKKFVATLTLLLVLGVPVAVANIQTLYSWFPALKPALAHAIDVVTGYVPSSGPDFKVRHRVREVEAGCRYNPTGMKCLQYDHASVASVSIQSANSYPILLKEVVINEKEQCSVKPNTTLTLGDTYDVALNFCDPIKIRIVTDHGDAIYGFN